MKNLVLLLIIASMILVSCVQKVKNDNPLLNDFDTPFGVPPFDLIKASHFKPAYLKAFEEQKAEIKAIINNPSEPDFNNTIKMLTYSGELLNKVGRVFGALNSANTNDSLQAINREIAPVSSRHRDDINLNDTLFRRVKSVYDKRDNLNLTGEEKKLLEDTYKDFVRSGAALPPESKEKLRKINEELSMLQVKFGQNLLAETNGFKLILDRKEDLSGLPEGVIEQAASMAKSLKMDGKWVFTLQVPSMTPFLQYSDNRDLREKLFTGYFMKGDNDNEYDNKS
ncbi:MAG TPA: peptidase M3, partial [Bacteroidales bacterium]|nr:peptidase M3 [Bacteroidales bacterium]HBZ21455.1 peptidase M3 [Bacteroidales bacterium]